MYFFSVRNVWRLICILSWSHCVLTARDASVVVRPFAKIHHSAVIQKDSIIGHNVIVHDGVKIGPITHIGHRAVIASKSIIMSQCTVGSHVNIYSECSLEDKVFVNSYSNIGPKAKLQRGVRIMGVSDVRSLVELGEHTIVDRHSLIDFRAKIGKNVYVGKFVKIAPSVTVGSGSILHMTVPLAKGTRVPANTIAIRTPTTNCLINTIIDNYGLADIPNHLMRMNRREFSNHVVSELRKLMQNEWPKRCQSSKKHRHKHEISGDKVRFGVLTMAYLRLRYGEDKYNKLISTNYDYDNVMNEQNDLHFKTEDFLTEAANNSFKKAYAIFLDSTRTLRLSHNDSHCENIKHIRMDRKNVVMYDEEYEPPTNVINEETGADERLQSPEKSSSDEENSGDPEPITNEADDSFEGSNGSPRDATGKARNADALAVVPYKPPVILGKI